MKKSLSFSIVFGLFGSTGAAASDLEKVYQQLHSLNSMREGLASTLDPRKEPITEETFKRVCMPVGKQLKEWSQAQGYEARQLARKNRNPQNSVTAKDQAAWDLFERDAKLIQHKSEGPAGTTAYVRIPVTAACLHCHGPKEARPDFIKKKYPEDRAYDFAAGDLRGIYAVHIPSKAKK
jgi:hypothetical protein